MKDFRSANVTNSENASGLNDGDTISSSSTKTIGGHSRKVTKNIGITALPSNTSHFQDGPRIGNQYLEDPILRNVLLRYTGGPDKNESILKQADSELTRLGHRVATDLLEHHKKLNDPHNQPYLEQYDAWGRRVDNIITSESWKVMKKAAAEEGIVATGYNSPYGRYNRLIQFAKLLLYNPSSGLYPCPLAMTDGAANLMRNLVNQDPKDENIKRYFGDFKNDANPEVVEAVKQAYEKLTSRDPKLFETSGQWMTERGGGSDVGVGTETIARLQSDGSYKLYGYKWFTSATDSDMTVTLARIEDPDTGSVGKGSGGLSCFLVRVRNEDGSLNNMRVHRLKDKLGTRQLPTAEMELLGSRALLLSLPGKGVGAITGGMVNTTRVYNSISAVSSIRRMVALNRDYMYRRVAFGRKLSDNPLHLRTIAQLELDYRANLCFTMDVVSMMGDLETKSLSPEETHKTEILLRLLTPVLKLYTAKAAIANASEGLEGFGGQGYIESTHIPVILRDAQVLPIWEGTTNVLSHDVLRVLSKSSGEAFRVLANKVRSRCELARKSTQFENCVSALTNAVNDIEQFLKTTLSDLRLFQRLESRARDLSYSLARVYTASCLLEHALWSGEKVDIAAVRKFTLNRDTPLVCHSLLPAVGENAEAHDDEDVALLALYKDFGDKNEDGTLRSKY